MIQRAKCLAHTHTHIHRPDGRPNVFLFSTPRSGSTWLMELIWSQPGFKFCDEPLNLRNPGVARSLGIDRWSDLFTAGSESAVERYFRAICRGDLRTNGPRPFHRFYRPVTHRIVFKEIHAGHDHLDWFRDAFNGRIAYLVRHPIAVSLSREELPTLDALLEGPYQQHFTGAQLRYADQIRASGTDLERGVLAWCVQNAVPLRAPSPDWAVVSYEELILDPVPVVRYLCEKLDLPAPERMLRGLTSESFSARKSDQATRQILQQGDDAHRQRLVDKWREKVSVEDERRALAILERFDLDTYRAGSALPSDSLMVEGRRASERQHCEGGTAC